MEFQRKKLTINMTTRSGKLKSMQSKKHGAFKRVPFSDIPEGWGPDRGAICVHRGGKPISAGRKKGGAYVDGNRKLGARLCVKGRRGFAGSNASAPTVQLQIIRLRLDVIAHRKWDFRASDVTGAF